MTPIKSSSNDHKDVQRTQEKTGWTEQEVRSFPKELENIKKNQKEMKNTVTVVQETR